jgi:hypothetical protein
MLATIALDAPAAGDGIRQSSAASGDRAAMELLIERLRFGPLTRRRVLAQLG